MKIIVYLALCVVCMCMTLTGEVYGQTSFANANVVGGPADIYQRIVVKFIEEHIDPVTKRPLKDLLPVAGDITVRNYSSGGGADLVNRMCDKNTPRDGSQIGLFTRATSRLLIGDDDMKCGIQDFEQVLYVGPLNNILVLNVRTTGIKSVADFVRGPAQGMEKVIIAAQPSVGLSSISNAGFLEFFGWGMKDLSLYRSNAEVKLALLRGEVGLNSMNSEIFTQLHREDFFVNGGVLMPLCQRGIYNSATEKLDSEKGIDLDLCDDIMDRRFPEKKDSVPYRRFQVTGQLAVITNPWFLPGGTDARAVRLWRDVLIKVHADPLFVARLQETNQVLGTQFAEPEKMRPLVDNILKESGKLKLRELIASLQQENEEKKK